MYKRQEEIRLEAHSYGTDCYPLKKIETAFRLSEINEAVLYNPRNAYQNYNVAVNLGQKTIYTYMAVSYTHLRQIYAALREGRCYVSYDRLYPGKGFSFTACLLYTSRCV